MTIIETAGAIGAAALVLAGCGAGAERAEQPTSPAASEQPAPAPEPKPVALSISSPDDGAEVQRARVRLRGTAEPGAEVRVDGEAVDVERDGAWSQQIPLRLGQQVVDVEASKDGREDATRPIRITRRRSRAELAALRQRRVEARERRIAVRAQAEANFKAAASAVPYKQLEKNANRYKGTKVVYRGQIFQIQESDGGGGILLLSVTDDGYGFWDDHIWVDYDGHVKGAEDDIITVYGTVTGSKSYETQIGGETYVPRMRAKYVAE